MDSERLVDSLRMLCHQPGGKKRASPGPKVARMEWGITLAANSGNSFKSCGLAKTSTREVFFNCELGKSDSDTDENVYIASDTSGGASQTDLCPTI